MKKNYFFLKASYMILMVEDKGEIRDRSPGPFPVGRALFHRGDQQGEVPIFPSICLAHFTLVRPLSKLQPQVLNLMGPIGPFPY